MLQEIKDYAESVVAELRGQYERNAAQLREAAAARGAGVAATRCELVVRAQTPTGVDTPSPYDGKQWNFDLSNSCAVPIGRSKAKKFQQNGISMPKDSGVSTSHAKVKMFLDPTGRVLNSHVCSHSKPRSTG